MTVRFVRLTAQTAKLANDPEFAHAIVDTAHGRKSIILTDSQFVGLVTTLDSAAGMLFPMGTIFREIGR